MRKRLLVALVLAVLVAPSTASAHPLGNFTINRFSRIELAGHRVYVLYVLDLAEIPTFQAGTIEPHAYAVRIARGAELRVDGRPSALVPVATALAHPLGAGGLHTTRLEVMLEGPRLAGAASIAYADHNYADRIGWKEVVVGAASHSISDELRAYPRNLLQSPLDETSVDARLVPSNGPETAPPLRLGRSLQAPDRVADAGFARLIAQKRLSALVVLASLAAAVFWGAAHALSPGHGKTIVTSYLVGQRGTPRHAALLGLVVTATHTIGVFGLGIVTLLLSRFIVPDHLYPWLNLVAGLLVVGIGTSVLAARLRRHRGHGHEHHQHHDHAHITTRSLLAVGVSGGLLPCPSALVVLLAAISLHRVAFGLVLIVAFSVGLALSITCVGLAAVAAKRAFRRLQFEGRLVRLLPALSSVVILVAGTMMTLHAIPRLR